MEVVRPPLFPVLKEFRIDIELDFFWFNFLLSFLGTTKNRISIEAIWNLGETSKWNRAEASEASQASRTR